MSFTLSIFKSLLTVEIKEKINVEINTIQDCNNWQNISKRVSVQNFEKPDLDHVKFLRKKNVWEDLAKLSLNLWNDYEYYEQFTFRAKYDDEDYIGQLVNLGYECKDGEWKTSKKPSLLDVQLNIFMYCMYMSMCNDIDVKEDILQNNRNELRQQFVFQDVNVCGNNVEENIDIQPLQYPPSADNQIILKDLTCFQIQKQKVSKCFFCDNDLDENMKCSGCDEDMSTSGGADCKTRQKSGLFSRQNINCIYCDNELSGSECSVCNYKVGDECKTEINTEKNSLCFENDVNIVGQKNNVEDSEEFLKSFNTELSLNVEIENKNEEKKEIENEDCGNSDIVDIVEHELDLKENKKCCYMTKVCDDSKEYRSLEEKEETSLCSKYSEANFISKNNFNSKDEILSILTSSESLKVSQCNFQLSDLSNNQLEENVEKNISLLNNNIQDKSFSDSKEVQKSYLSYKDDLHGLNVIICDNELSDNKDECPLYISKIEDEIKTGINTEKDSSSTVDQNDHQDINNDAQEYLTSLISLDVENEIETKIQKYMGSKNHINVCLASFDISKNEINEDDKKHFNENDRSIIFKENKGNCPEVIPRDFNLNEPSITSEENINLKDEINQEEKNLSETLQLVQGDFLTKELFENHSSDNGEGIKEQLTCAHCNGNNSKNKISCEIREKMIPFVKSSTYEGRSFINDNISSECCACNIKYASIKTTECGHRAINCKFHEACDDCLAKAKEELSRSNINDSFTNDKDKKSIFKDDKILTKNINISLFDEVQDITDSAMDGEINKITKFKENRKKIEENIDDGTLIQYKVVEESSKIITESSNNELEMLSNNGKIVYSKELKDDKNVSTTHSHLHEEAHYLGKNSRKEIHTQENSVEYTRSSEFGDTDSHSIDNNNKIMEGWTCTHCDKNNSSDRICCEICDKYAPFVKFWTCEACTFNNNKTSSECGTCEAKNPNLKICKCESMMINVKFNEVCDNCLKKNLEESSRVLNMNNSRVNNEEEKPILKDAKILTDNINISLFDEVQNITDSAMDKEINKNIKFKENRKETEENIEDGIQNKSMEERSEIIMDPLHNDFRISSDNVRIVYIKDSKDNNNVSSTYPHFNDRTHVTKKVSKTEIHTAGNSVEPKRPSDFDDTDSNTCLVEHSKEFQKKNKKEKAIFSKQNKIEKSGKMHLVVYNKSDDNTTFVNVFKEEIKENIAKNQEKTNNCKGAKSSCGEETLENYVE